MVKLYIVDVVKNRFLKRQRITYIKANRQTGRQTDKRRQRTPKTSTLSKSTENTRSGRTQQSSLESGGRIDGRKMDNGRAEGARQAYREADRQSHANRNTETK